MKDLICQPLLAHLGEGEVLTVLKIIFFIRFFCQGFLFEILMFFIFLNNEHLLQKEIVELKYYFVIGCERFSYFYMREFILYEIFKLLMLKKIVLLFISCWCVRCFVLVWWRFMLWYERFSSLGVRDFHVKGFLSLVWEAFMLWC